MTRYSDAALLRGKFAHLAAELRAGQRQAPSRENWRGVANEHLGEQAAQEVAKQIFAFQQQLDPKTEQMVIVSGSALGPMRVLAIFPGEDDYVRVDGIVFDINKPVSIFMHASQLFLTFDRTSLDDKELDDDGLNIGFVIFDELTERQKARKDGGILPIGAEAGDSADQE